MTKSELIADYCFRYPPRLKSVGAKTFPEIWYLLYESRVVDSKKDIKDEYFYTMSKKFITGIIDDCENAFLPFDNYDKEVLNSVVYHLKLAIKKTNFNASQSKEWDDYLKKIEAIAASIEYKSPELIAV